MAKSNVPLELGPGRPHVDHAFAQAALSTGLNECQTDTFIKLFRGVVFDKIDFTFTDHNDLQSCLEVPFNKEMSVFASTRSHRYFC